MITIVTVDGTELDALRRRIGGATSVRFALEDGVKVSAGQGMWTLGHGTVTSAERYRLTIRNTSTDTTFDVRVIGAAQLAQQVNQAAEHPSQTILSVTPDEL